MARKLSGYEGGVLVSGGIEPAGDFYVAEAGYILAENGKDLSTKLAEIDALIGGNGGESLPSQINTINDNLSNYYTKTQLDAISGTGAKIDKSAIQTVLTNENTDIQVPSAKATFNAIEAAKEAAIAAAEKTDIVADNINIPVTSAGVFNKLTEFVTQEDLANALYKNITVSASCSPSTVEFKATANGTVTWNTSMIPKSVKVAGTEVASNYSTTNGTKSVTLDTSSAGSKSIPVSVVGQHNETANANATYTVTYKIYYGIAELPETPDGQFIKSLGPSGGKLQSNAKINVTLTPVIGKYFFLAFPKTYTVPNFAVNDYGTEFVKVNGDIAVDVNGTAVSYVLYRNPAQFTEVDSYKVVAS